MKPDFALMIPVYNGGDLLKQTLQSCLAARFDPARVAVVVCDNGSNDGSYEAAAALAAGSGGLLTVRRNEANLGRIGNWNRCIEAAEQMGARFGSFLMVGDEWLPGADALAIVAALLESGANLALARFHLVDAEGRLERVGRNFIRSPHRSVPAQEFIRLAIREAALCFGPLQANVYRLDGPRRLRFDAQDPIHTDQRATLAFIEKDTGVLLLWDRPCFAWKAHAGRFHMGMDVTQRVQGDLEMIRSVAGTHEISIDDRRINVNLFLLIARELAGRPQGLTRIREVARSLQASRGGLDWGLALRQIFRRVVLHRHIV